MPELPEVETIIRDLRKRILGIKIFDIEVLLPRIVKNTKVNFKKKLINNRFLNIERIGKLIVIKLERGGFLLVHLKMTGQLIYQKGKKIIAGGHSEGNVRPVPSEVEGVTLPNKWTRVVLTFQDKSKLYFNDLRTFGYLRIVDNKELEVVKSKFGVEPLGIELTLNLFKEKIKPRKTSIKVVLLNQQIIAGLGNIYVDEILFRAGLRPTRKASGLKNKELEAIYKAIRPILRQAIKARGTTFNNFVDADGHVGNFISRLKVYGRAGEKCKKCGSKIKKIKVAGRGTHFCAQCQK